MRSILILIPLFLIIIVAVIMYFRNQKNKIQPSDDKISCNISSNPSLLTKCDPSDRNACTNCTQGLYSCITVDSQNQHTINQNGTETNIPTGSWCLPPIVKTFPCNTFSGYRVLTKISDSEFAWKCHCKYPELLSNRGVEFGDCTYPVACEGNPLVCPPEGKYCTPGKQWIEEPTYDPTYAVCACPSGTNYIHNDPPPGSWDKRCVLDTCIPGHSSQSSGNNGCVCPDKSQDSSGNWTSYIKCPQNVAEDKKIQCSFNQCVQDPCNPNGYYDSSQGKCVCTTKGYTNKQDSESAIKNVCYAPCDDQHNPCGSRGDCNWAITDNAVVTTCINCKTPWKQDSTNMCNFHMKNIGDSCSTNSDCISDYCEPKYGLWGDLVCQNM